MKDVEEPIHAFSFINKTLLQLTDKECAAFRSEIISRIPELFYLNRLSLSYLEPFLLFFLCHLLIHL